MLFTYKAIDKDNTSREGTVEASNSEAAIATVQKEGYTVISIVAANESKSILDIEIEWFNSVSTRDVVILSRQISTLFEAQVSALRVFRLLAAETENKVLSSVLEQVADDLQAGSSISRALASHPDVFSQFYVSMVRSGEESGTLDKAFSYLASYLDRQYQLTSKAKNALMYPAFVVGTFVLVMSLMLTLVIPRVASILEDSGQELPIYTEVVIGLSNFMVNYIGLLLIMAGVGGFFAYRFFSTEAGARVLDEFKLSVPYVGSLYQKVYLTRICDNLSTMLSSGISLPQTLEVTSEVVDNRVFKEILEMALIEVRGGRSFAESIAEYPEIPGVFSQMAAVGEETGNLSDILSTLAKFYQREVNNAVETLIGLIEPVMIVLLGLGVGLLLVSVLMPIYNLTNTI